MKSYCITLARSAERTAETQRHFEAIGLPDVTFFPGVDGVGPWRMSTRHTYDVDHPGTNYHIGPITIALLLSHYALWNHIRHQSGQHFLIMENDCRFLEGWKPKLDQAIASLPEGWGILYPGSCCLQTSTHVAGCLWRTPYAMCTHAYIVNQWSVEQLIATTQEIWAPLDINMHFRCAIPKYAIKPRICEQNATVLPP